LCCDITHACIFFSSGFGATGDDRPGPQSPTKDGRSPTSAAGDAPAVNENRESKSQNAHDVQQGSNKESPSFKSDSHSGTSVMPLPDSHQADSSTKQLDVMASADSRRSVSPSRQNDVTGLSDSQGSVSSTKQDDLCHMNSLLQGVALPCARCNVTSDVTLQPCGHVCVCRKCCDAISRCPQCDSVIEKRVVADLVAGMYKQ
jgi:hypothetical protein